MNTSVHELVSSIDQRWQEVKILIDQASKEQDRNPDLYDALCRATVVLIVAHLEGFIKAIARAILLDINDFSSFKQSPSSLKRTFCKKFTGVEAESNRKIDSLIEMLDSLETKFVVDPFLIESSYGNNKNPSPTVIERVCANFGINNVFGWLDGSKLDIVFNGITSEIEALLDELISHTSTCTKSYPYSLDVSLFSISKPSSKSKSKVTFWVTFLDELMRNRNDIAHGSLLTNRLSVGELTDFRNKVAVLKYALVLVLCHASAER